jgi:hypothetical protein
VIDTTTTWALIYEHDVTTTLGWQLAFTRGYPGVNEWDGNEERVIINHEMKKKKTHKT